MISLRAPEYGWQQDHSFCAALLAFGVFDAIIPLKLRVRR
jgi:hypothetical protein